MKILKSEEFNELVMNNKNLVLVDFFATWCGPCKMLSPILEQVAESAQGKYDVYKIDVDESYDIAKQYGIMSVPTMLVFKDGEVKQQIVGLRSKKDIEDVMTSLL